MAQATPASRRNAPGEMAAGRVCARGFVACAVRPAARAFSRSQALASPLTAEQLAKKMRAQKEKQRKPQHEVRLSGPSGPGGGERKTSYPGMHRE